MDTFRKTMRMMTTKYCGKQITKTVCYYMVSVSITKGMFGAHRIICGARSAFVVCNDYPACERSLSGIYR